MREGAQGKSESSRLFQDDWLVRREERKKGWLGARHGNWVKNSFLKMGEASAHANTDGKGPVDIGVNGTGKRRKWSLEGFGEEGTKCK